MAPLPYHQHDNNCRFGTVCLPFQNAVPRLLRMGRVCLSPPPLGSFVWAAEQSSIQSTQRSPTANLPGQVMEIPRLRLGYLRPLKISFSHSGQTNMRNPFLTRDKQIWEILFSLTRDKQTWDILFLLGTNKHEISFSHSGQTNIRYPFLTRDKQTSDILFSLGTNKHEISFSHSGHFFELTWDILFSLLKNSFFV